MSNEPQNPESRFETVVDALRDTPIAEGPDELFRHRLLVRLSDENLSLRSVQRPLAKRRTAMPRIAVIAASLLLVGGITAWIASSGSREGAAFANMLAKIDDAQTVTYKTRVELAGFNPPMESTTMLRLPDLMRDEITEGPNRDVTIHVFNLKEHKSLTLRPGNKKAQFRTTAAQSPDQPQNVVEQLRAVRELSAQFEGTEKIDGQDTRKFRCDQASGHYLIWMAKDSDLPVKAIVQETAPGSKESVTITMTDFQWNVPLDAALFSLDLPKGYELQTQGSWPSPNDPKYFIEAMRVFVHLNHDEFPDEYNALTPASIIKFLDDPSIPPEKRQDFMRQKLAEALDRPDMLKMSAEEWGKEGQENAKRFAAGSVFLQVLSQTNEWHYVGKGAKAGQADRIVAWWAPKNGDGKATVLFGDFHLETKAAAGLPVDTK
jgi:outer membrane lipoprotein-sorting protein